MKKITTLILLTTALSLLSNRIAAQHIGVCGGVRMTAVADTSKGAESSGTCPDFQIELTYNPNVSQSLRNVITFAANEWSAILRNSEHNPCDYPISVKWGLLPVGTLAYTITTFKASNGDLISAEITFSNSVSWFVDATPENDSEFQGGIPPTGYDLLSVARHEFGHAIGWVPTNRVTSFYSNNIFDEQRLNIAFQTKDTSHTSDIHHAYDLMNPAISEGERRGISYYPDVAMVSMAFEYDTDRLRAARINATNATGSVFRPYPTVQTAFNTVNSPANTTLILLPGTFNESNLIRSTPMTIMAPRGKTVRIE